VLSEPRRDQPDEHREAAALLAAGAARARLGAGGLVVVRGATGTGRTTVLDAAAEEAAAHGMRVLRARCRPGDATVPFAAALQLLGPPYGFEAWEAPGGDRERAALLRRALRSCADESPLLLAVDDVHLADPASHRWLVELAHDVDRLPLPVLLAVTERSQYDIDPPAPGFAHTLPPARVRAHTLAPLSAASAAELVRAAFPAATEAWVDSCVRAGAGSPLLLRALLADLADLAAHGAPGGYPAVPDTSAALYPGAYQAAVRWWLDSAGPGTVEAARTLAALDEACDGETAGAAPNGSAANLGPPLGELTGTDPARMMGWLTAMTHLGMLRLVPGPSPHHPVDPAVPDPHTQPTQTGPEPLPHDGPRRTDPATPTALTTFGTEDGPTRTTAGVRLRYAHPLLRDAVLTGVPVARRRAVCRAAAESMLHLGLPTELVAWQLLLSDPVGASWTPVVLRDAASLALRAGRVDDAVAFLRRALKEPLPDGQRQQLLTELGSLEYTSRDSSAGIPRLWEALRLPSTAQDRVRAAVALGTALGGRGRTRAAVELLRTVDRELAGHPEAIGPLHTACALLSDRDQSLREEVYQRLSDTVAQSPRLASPAARALLVRYTAAASLASADEAMWRLHQLLAEPADPSTEPVLLGAAATVALWADRLDEAERFAERGLVTQRTDLLHPIHEALHTVRADIAAARGPYTPLPEQPPTTAHTTPTHAHAHTLIALVETCRPTEAQRLADAFDLRATPNSSELNQFLYARGVQRSAAGDTTGALHDFMECGRRQSALNVQSPVVTPWRSAAAECRLALGCAHGAHTLAEEELRLARVWGTPRTVGRALRVLGTVTGGRPGLELTEEAVRLLRDAPPAAERELVSALIAHGRLLATAGNSASERYQARRGLREAAERAERLVAPRLWTLAETSLRESGARRTAPARTGSSSLTSSELRIARMAADGHTNKEIADLLYLARRTVETHLTNTYKKLGIRRRDELKETLNGA
jgi:DNA-binding CsgD family transcriptional regulator